MTRPVMGIPMVLQIVLFAFILDFVSMNILKQYAWLGQLNFIKNGKDIILKKKPKTFSCRKDHTDG